MIWDCHWLRSDDRAIIGCRTRLWNCWHFHLVSIGKLSGTYFGKERVLTSHRSLLVFVWQPGTFGGVHLATISKEFLVSCWWCICWSPGRSDSVPGWLIERQTMTLDVRTRGRQIQPQGGPTSSQPFKGRASDRPPWWLWSPGFHRQ
jgi:hypothetical protein